jgi:hypothetical protein
MNAAPYNSGGDEEWVDPAAKANQEAAVAMFGAIQQMSQPGPEFKPYEVEVGVVYCARSVRIYI